MINITTKKLEIESKLKNHTSEVKNLQKKIKTCDDKIEDLQYKFFSNNKYDDFIDDLYVEDILDDNDIDMIQNNSKNKDDLER